MNKTETKKQVDYSNIREMQNLVKNRSISTFAMNLKSFRQRIEAVETKWNNVKAELQKQRVLKENEAKSATESKPQEQTKVQSQVVQNETPKPAQSVQKQPEKPVIQKDVRQNSQGVTGHQSSNFENKNGRNFVQNGNRQGFDSRNNQQYNKNNFNRGQNGTNQRSDGNFNRGSNNFSSRPTGKFTPTGERRFDNNYGERRQNSFGGTGSYNGRNSNGYGQGQGFAKKPYGQNGTSSTGFGAQRFQKPTETYSASTLAKTSTRQQQKKKSSYERSDEKKTINKKALLQRGYAENENSMIESEQNEQVTYKKHGRKLRDENPTKIVQKIDHAVITTDNLTVKILAETIGKSVPELMSKFLLLGMMVNINSNIDFGSAELVASEFGITLEKKVEKSFEEKLAENYASVVDTEENLQKRPAVVTVMGHVDHGKTSLLDQIRKTNVVSGEAGGITQSIGAYTITINGEIITFIDTPGHAAFTAMRERGAKLTDIAILVVAADDGVMPQTVECINQIKQTKCPMIVAINKIDVPKANVENVKTQLASYGVMPEEWGGDAIMVPISAKHGTNIDKLLEMVLFVAEYQNLRANPNRDASGSIIEAKLDKGVGAVATVLVQNGTLKVGDYVVVGTCTGKIRAMTNDKHERIKSATPSMPVQIIGLSGVPNAGDELFVVDEKMSRQVALERQNQAKVDMIKSADLSIETMMNKIADSNFKDYNVIVKADVQGSVEALRGALSTLQNEEVKVRFVSGGVGAVNENDVSMAQASNALIVAFNTKTDFKAKVLSEKYKVEIKNSKIIYEVIDYITERINKMIAPKYKEVVTGHAEIRQTFKASKVGLIAGTYVLDGKISKDSKVRVYRGDKKIFEGAIGSLQREKNEAKEVDAGFECGVTFAGFTDFMIGDTFETYIMQRIN